MGICTGNINNIVNVFHKQVKHERPRILCITRTQVDPGLAAQCLRVVYNSVDLAFTDHYHYC